LSTVCLSMYSITENIYYSQLSSVTIFLQPEPNCCTSYNTRTGFCSLSLLSSCGLRLPPTCLVLTVKGARSYFASTIRVSHRSCIIEDTCSKHIGKYFKIMNDRPNTWTTVSVPKRLKFRSFLKPFVKMCLLSGEYRAIFVIEPLLRTALYAE
jgi:hypothetical protein